MKNHSVTFQTHSFSTLTLPVDSSWNVMADDDAREGKWRGNWRVEWVANTLHTTSEHGVSSITTTDAHTSVASSRTELTPPGRFKWTRPFRPEIWNLVFFACAITFQLASTNRWTLNCLVTQFVSGFRLGIITEIYSPDSKRHWEIAVCICVVHWQPFTTLDMFIIYFRTDFNCRY